MLVVTGTQALGGTEVTIAALPTWFPLVDVYVDVTSDPNLANALFRVYAVTPSTATPIASAQLSGPGAGLRLLANVPGEGATIELRAVSKRGTTLPVTAAIVGYSANEGPGVQEATAAVGPLPSGTIATPIVALPWNPLVEAFVQGGSNAAGAEWTILANLTGFSAPVFVAGGAFGNVTPSSKIGQALGGATSWSLEVAAVAGPMGAITCSLVATQNNGAGGGSGPSPSPAFLSQPTWFIDAVAGSDSNTGLTAGTALKTDAELFQRRWGAGAHLTGSTVVTFLSNLPQTDPAFIDVTVGNDVQVVIQGTPTNSTPLGAGTILAVTAKNQTGNQRWEITDAAIANWAPFVNLRLQITGPPGPRVGATAYVQASAGGAAFTSDWIIASPGVFTPNITPLAGDTYEILTDSTCYIAQLDVDTDEQGVATGSEFVVQNLSVLSARTNELVVDAASDLVVLQNCTIAPVLVGGLNGGALNLLGCNLLGGGTAVSGTLAVFAGQAPGPLLALAGGRLLIDYDCLTSGMTALGGGTLALAQAASFGAIADANNLDGSGVFLQPGGSCMNRNYSSGSHLVWGTGNAGMGVHAMGGSNFAVEANTPVVKGGLPQDFKLGGSVVSRAWNDAISAYTANILNTWANFNLSLGAGGFGGNAHNLIQNAHLFLTGM